MDFIQKNSLKVHNEDFTRFSSCNEPSVIDHIVSNCPEKLSCVSTNLNTVSDHCHLTCNIFIRIPKSTQVYKKIRDWSKLTR